jgi:2-keto-4-pentenoate hydratase
MCQSPDVLLAVCQTRHGRLAVSDAEALAARLRDAYTRGAVAPLRDGLGALDGDLAYQIQAINTRYWQQQGRKLVGRKVGLTSPAVQTQLGVKQCDFGALFEDMRIGNGGTLGPEQVLQPKVEAEVALILVRDLPSEETSAHEVTAATGASVVAIEIVDSRIADWNITFADTVADNGSSAFFVLGDDPKPPVGLDLWSCGMVLEVNGQTASCGAGAACLGHPMNAAAWLARTLAMAGQPLKAGDLVLTGALGPMVAITPGDQIKATIGGLGSCYFRYRSAG